MQKRQPVIDIVMFYGPAVSSFYFYSKVSFLRVNLAESKVLFS